MLIGHSLIPRIWYETPPEDKPPEEVKPPEKKPETVPVYVERHELHSALDEIRKMFNDGHTADTARFDAIEAKLTTQPKPEEKPKGEGEHAEEKEVPGEATKPKPGAKRKPWRLWRTV